MGMNVLIVLAHPERRSFNGAMFATAQMALQAAGHTVVTSDLYRMGFDPVSSRRNFVSVKDADHGRVLPR
jgi:NAD(P)H dehydrogenase (quinone)